MTKSMTPPWTWSGKVSYHFELNHISLLFSIAKSKIRKYLHVAGVPPPRHSGVRPNPCPHSMLHPANGIPRPPVSHAHANLINFLFRSPLKLVEHSLSFLIYVLFYLCRQGPLCLLLSPVFDDYSLTPLPKTIKRTSQPSPQSEQFSS